ncbi:MAG: DNA phosphorothioation system sulfurtransferase DndC, partial [Geminicoccaceae bacterium]|nr:DNA phosphorothioation system sulfurtransferase DndC [Geminicoccaceae bacterium]
MRADLRDEYRQPHADPWILCFSGGKDSTLVAHLVFEMLFDLAPDERRRPVHVVANDMLVESPLVIAHIRRVLGEIEHAARAWRLPVRTVITRPAEHQTFWV